VFTVPDNLDRDSLIKHLKARSIETTIGTFCQSNLPFYKNKYGNVQPNAARLETKTITLPCYQDLPTERVCDCIKEFFDLAVAGSR